MSGPAVGVQVWGAGAAALTARARQVEELGFDAVSVPDHLVGPLGAPLLTCAVLAQATSRVRVQTWVLNNDLRHPAVLAREVAALAELSGGRFELGLGAGHAKEEYDRTGIPFDPGPVRVARMCESVQILRRLLAGEEVTFEGEHYRLTGRAHRAGAGRAGADPARRQQPGGARLRGAARRRPRAHRLRAARPRRPGGDRRLQPGGVRAPARPAAGARRRALRGARPAGARAALRGHRRAGRAARAARRPSTGSRPRSCPARPTWRSGRRSRSPRSGSTCTGATASARSRCSPTSPTRRRSRRWCRCSSGSPPAGTAGSGAGVRPARRLVRRGAGVGARRRAYATMPRPSATGARRHPQDDVDRAVNVTLRLCCRSVADAPGHRRGG